MTNIKPKLTQDIKDYLIKKVSDTNVKIKSEGRCNFINISKYADFLMHFDCDKGFLLEHMPTRHLANFLEIEEFWHVLSHEDKSNLFIRYSDKLIELGMVELGTEHNHIYKDVLVDGKYIGCKTYFGNFNS